MRPGRTTYLRNPTRVAPAERVHALLGWRGGGTEQDACADRWFRPDTGAVPRRAFRPLRLRVDVDSAAACATGQRAS